MIKASRVVVRVGEGVFQVETAIKVMDGPPMAVKYLWTEYGERWYTSVNGYDADEETPVMFIPVPVVNALSGKRMSEDGPWSLDDDVEFVDIDPILFMVEVV